MSFVSDIIYLVFACTSILFIVIIVLLAIMARLRVAVFDARTLEHLAENSVAARQQRIDETDSEISCKVGSDHGHASSRGLIRATHHDE